MASAYKVLAQLAPTASSNQDVLTVGAGKSVIVSKIVITNRATRPGDPAGFDLAIVPSGDTIGNKNYICTEELVNPRKSVIKGAGITLAAGDKIVINPTSATFSISVFGVEIS